MEVDDDGVRAHAAQRPRRAAIASGIRRSGARAASRSRRTRSGRTSEYAEHRDPQPAGAGHDGRRPRRPSVPPPSVCRPYAARVAQRVDERLDAEVERVVVRDRDGVEPGACGRGERRRRAAERVLLARSRPSRASRPRTRGSPPRRRPRCRTGAAGFHGGRRRAVRMPASIRSPRLTSPTAARTTGRTIRSGRTVRRSPARRTSRYRPERRGARTSSVNRPSVPDARRRSGGRSRAAARARPRRPSPATRTRASGASHVGQLAS